jgi:hypothetical protein
MSNTIVWYRWGGDPRKDQPILVTKYDAEQLCIKYPQYYYQKSQAELEAEEEAVDDFKQRQRKRRKTDFKRERKTNE